MHERTIGVHAAMGMNITLAPRRTFVKAFARICEFDSGWGAAVPSGIVLAIRLGKCGAILGGLTDAGLVGVRITVGFACGAGSSNATSEASATVCRAAC